MSVTRGDFLKQLGKSLPGMVLGTGAAAAQTLLGKIAAVSGTPETPVPQTPSPVVSTPEPELITSGPVDSAEIALTFDDGPWPGVTDRILNELKARNVHATFFMIGECIAKSPDLARRVLAEGHDVGNHTYTHPKLSELPEAQAIAEIQKTQEILARQLDCKPSWFRPPYGAFRANQASLLEQHGLRDVRWSTDPADWSAPGEDKIVETVLEKATAGAIVLLHDRQEQTANGLARMLDGLAAKGLKPVTLSQLLSRRA